MLAKLSQLETTPVLKDSATDLKPFGLDKPQGKITIETSEFKSGLTLLIGKDENKLLYVRNSAEPFIYTVPDTSFDFLQASNLDLRDARVINLKREAVKTMTITAGFRTDCRAQSQRGRHVDASQCEGPHGRREQGQHPGESLLPVAGQDVARAGAARVRPGETGADNFGAGGSAVAGGALHRRAACPMAATPRRSRASPRRLRSADGDYGILNASSLQLIPKELSETNAPAATPPSTNAAARNRFLISDVLAFRWVVIRPVVSFHVSPLHSNLR